LLQNYVTRVHQSKLLTFVHLFCALELFTFTEGSLLYHIPSHTPNSATALQSCYKSSRFISSITIIILIIDRSDFPLKFRPQIESNMYGITASSIFFIGYTWLQMKPVIIFHSIHLHFIFINIFLKLLCDSTFIFVSVTYRSKCLSGQVFLQQC